MIEGRFNQLVDREQAYSEAGPLLDFAATGARYLEHASQQGHGPAHELQLKFLADHPEKVTLGVRNNFQV